MTRTRFDQFSKQLLDEFLAPLGTVEKSLEVLGESRLIDLYFAPSSQPTVDPKTLGMLGQIAVTPCLLEPFRNPPTPVEVRDCLLKLFWVHADLQRRAKRENRRLPEAELPQLWVLASSVSANLLDNFAATNREAWPLGVYLMGNALKTKIVAINQLPQTEETLWLRLLGKGATQEQAIAELLAFPKRDPRRSRALQLLASWKITLETGETLEAEEQGLMMTLSQAYLEWEQKTEARGKQQGIKTERETTIENLLIARFGAVDEQLAAIIPRLLALSAEDYAQWLLQLAQLSREEVLARVEDI